MDRIEYVYTVGMDESEVERRLERSETGVLALASGGDAYAFPVATHFQDGSIFIRLARDKSSQKMDYLEDTETACLTFYDVGPAGDSWSVIVTGSLRKLVDDEREQFDEATVNESFLQLRIFDEDVVATDLEIYEFEMASITGRKTVD